jgi:hypothetical protein
MADEIKVLGRPMAVGLLYWQRAELGSVPGELPGVHLLTLCLPMQGTVLLSLLPGRQ